MEKRYRVTLLKSERDELRKLVSVGKSAAQKLVCARILLLADQAEGGSARAYAPNHSEKAAKTCSAKVLS